MINSAQVLVVIPTLVADVDFLTKCLVSVKKFSNFGSIAIQLILTEKSSESKVKDIIDTVDLGGSCSVVVGQSVPQCLNDILMHGGHRFVILLHDDTELLPQEKDQWINTLVQPFSNDNRLVATGPHRVKDSSSRYDYLDPFCVAFNVDMWRSSKCIFKSSLARYFVREWCDAVQSQDWSIKSVSSIDTSQGMVIGTFPIYHAGGHTFNHIAGRSELDKKELTLVNHFTEERIKSFASVLTKRPSILFEVPASSSSASNVLTRVVATISTKDRVKSTLPLAIFSVAQQTVVPAVLAIFYDSPESFDFNVEPYSTIFSILSAKGCQVVVYQGGLKGQVTNHQLALELFVDHDFVWRIDDDNIAEPAVLESLYKQILTDSSIGAIAPLVHSPKEVPPRNPGLCSAKIVDIATHLNVQWTVPPDQKPIVAEHLYSTFLYRRDAALVSGGYPRNLSCVGHREETIFTNRMFRHGFSLLILPTAVMWHLAANHGGIRSPEFRSEMWVQDEEIFVKYMLSTGRQHYTDIRVITLDSGVGDHLAFVQAWPHIYHRNRSKNPTTKIVIGACYPDVIKFNPVSKIGVKPNHATIVSIAEAHSILASKRVPVDNVYEWMAHHQWKESLVQAYKSMYE